MSCQLRPLTYSLGLSNAPRLSFKLVQYSRASNINDVSNSGFIDVKWRGLDFTTSILLTNAL
jgi:hypothetical protein